MSPALAVGTVRSCPTTRTVTWASPESVRYMKWKLSLPAEMFVPPPRTKYTSFENTEPPSKPTAPMSRLVQGLIAEPRVNASRLLEDTDEAGSATSKQSASGDPHLAPSGMAVSF